MVHPARDPASVFPTQDCSPGACPEARVLGPHPEACPEAHPGIVSWDLILRLVLGLIPRLTPLGTKAPHFSQSEAQTLAPFHRPLILLLIEPVQVR